MRAKLIELRKQAKHTQESLAEVLGVSRQYIGMLESGARTPTLKLAKKIADYFQVDIGDIFFDGKCNVTLQKPNKDTMGLSRLNETA
jgi:putative transcriptional regulator